MHLWALLLFSVAVSGLRYRRSVEQHEHEYLHRRQSNVPDYTGPLVPSYNISMPIDHFNASDDRRYNNRYWINDTYYQPGGPVFLYDYGEQGIADASAAEFMAEVNGSSAVMELARNYNGLAVMWELRYYGYSLPFPLNVTYGPAFFFGREPDGSPQSLAYNTIDQALADVAYFAANMSQGAYQRSNMTALLPSNTPWVWVGGSYPGIRGAFMRVRYPETIYATWSSSAPTQAVIDGSSYFNGALRSLPSNCSTDIQALISYTDEVLAGDHGQDNLTYLQNLSYVAGSVPINVSAEYNISNAAAYNNFAIALKLISPYYYFFQSYGPSWTTRIFCDALQSYSPNTPGNVTTDGYISILTNPGNSTPSPNGFLAQNNNNLTLGLEAYLYAYRVYKTWEFESIVQRQDRNIVPPDFRGDQTAWLYTILTQFGWFQGSNPDNITIVPSWKNITASRQMDIEQSLSDRTAAVLPAEPDIDSVNKYGGWHINPANTMFTDGEFDPWRAGTVFSLESEIGAPGYQPTTDIPGCGQQPGNNTRFGLVYPGYVHVPDLLEDASFYGEGNNTAYKSGLELFQQALDVWLPCFGRDGANGASLDQTGGANATSTSTGAVAASANSAASLLLVIMVTVCLMIT